MKIAIINIAIISSHGSDLLYTVHLGLGSLHRYVCIHVCVCIWTYTLLCLAAS